MFLHNYAMGRMLKVKSRYFGDDRWYNSSLKMRGIIGTIWLHGACVCVCVCMCVWPCCDAGFARSAAAARGVRSSRSLAASTSGSRSTSANSRSSHRSRRRDDSATDRCVSSLEVAPTALETLLAISFTSGLFVWFSV